MSYPIAERRAMLTQASRAVTSRITMSWNSEVPASPLGASTFAQRFAEGTSRMEIGAPLFLQPSRRSHVLGWYTTSGS